MKIEEITETEEEYEKDYMSYLNIKVDGEDVFCFYEGEPEDNNLSRNF